MEQDKYYYVHFRKSDTFSFLDKEKGHVDIYDENGIYIAPLITGVVVDIYDFKETLNFTLKNGIVVKYKVEKPKRKFSLLGNYTCVGVVKALLNISNPFILTPNQLYKYLIKNKGELLWQQQQYQ